ncbi:CoF synthetase [Marinobacter sp. GN3S48]|uniref:CoF synthetase n=1 Tax=Marinobacter sp. GN3S48 TaxID=3382302 RepID=UPI00387AFABA
MLAVRDYCFRQYGVKLGAREARIWGTSRPNYLNCLKEWILHRKSFFVVSDNLQEVVEELRRWKPDYVYGYSSCILSLSKYLVEKNLSVPGVKLVVCTAEQVLPTHKKVIACAFESRVVEEYGSTEFDILGFEDRNGNLRLVNPWLVVESPDNYILVTDVYRSSQSFVRYKIGDIGKVEEKSGGEFGSTLVVEELQGRIGNRYVYGEGKTKFHSSEFSRVLNDYFDNSKDIFDFIVVQDDFGQCEVHVSSEPVIGFTQFCERLTKNIYRRTTVRLRVFPGTIGRLDRFKGKRSYFIQNIQCHERNAEGET